MKEVPVHRIFGIYSGMIPFNGTQKFLGHDKIAGRWVALDCVNGRCQVEYFKERTDAERWLNS